MSGAINSASSSVDMTNDYLVVGLACCYQLEDGDLKALRVLEPIPSAYLEALFQGVPTSYRCVWGTTVGAMLSGDMGLDSLDAEDVKLCQNFVGRVEAAARTYQTRPEAKEWVQLGGTRTDLNHSTERKRILNLQNAVTAEDNVRQHRYTHQTL